MLINGKTWRFTSLKAFLVPVSLIDCKGFWVEMEKTSKLAKSYLPRFQMFV
jgi:hypothetical protein